MSWWGEWTGEEGMPQYQPPRSNPNHPTQPPHSTPATPIHSNQSRFSYKGLGEPLCFFAFGPLATPAFYLTLASHTPQQQTQLLSAAAAAATSSSGGSGGLLAAVPPSVWVASVLVGISTTVILFCSHFHQIQGDVAAGKRSPLVKLGTERATRVLEVAVAAPYLLALAAAVAGALPAAVVLCALGSMPAARALLQFAEANRAVPERIAPLKRYAIRWHVLLGLALVVGLAGASSGWASSVRVLV